ncbi:MAG: AAA family ATPase [Candidatus Yanofskybacteria bacterium]|nr:AAA family ATPase [Candidatus Yanofskybacteria bacterium]
MWTIVGHDKHKRYFEQIIKCGQLSHAYLFCGPEGIGKKMFAYEIFRLINNREPENDPDFKLLTPRLDEDETKIYIEDVRNLKSYFSLKPYYGPYKFAVINDADRLVPEASNAMLKLLEEPSPFTVIILISSKPKLILPTVLSRCEEVRFLPPREKVIDQATAKAVDEFMKICKEGICERMQYAEKLFTGKNYQNLIVGLIHTLRARENPNHKILKNLLRLNYLLSQPHFNHRLALENFLINL